MNFANIDPQLSQFMAQILQFKQQFTSQASMVKGVDTTAFIASIDEFANQIGVEIQRQASGESTYQSPTQTIAPNIDMSAEVLQPTEIVKQGAKE